MEVFVSQLCAFVGHCICSPFTAYGNSVYFMYVYTWLSFPWLRYA
jgi:hypothetical protein